MNLIAKIDAAQVAALGNEIPDFKAGDTIRRGKSARIAEVTNYKARDVVGR